MRDDCFLSGDNSRRDIKAWVAVFAIVAAVLVYLIYAYKGLCVKDWPMPAGVRDITVALVIGGVLGAGATVASDIWGRRGSPPFYQEAPRPVDDEPVG